MQKDSTLAMLALGKTPFKLMALSDNTLVTLFLDEDTIDNRLVLEATENTPTKNFNFILELGPVGSDTYYIKNQELKQYLYISDNSVAPGDFIIMSYKDKPSTSFHIKYERIDGNLVFTRISNASDEQVVCISNSTINDNNVVIATDLQSRLSQPFVVFIKSNATILITSADTSPHLESSKPNVDRMFNWAIANEIFIDNILSSGPNSLSDDLGHNFETKDDFRQKVQTYLQNPITDSLIFYFCGHGTQRWANDINTIIKDNPCFKDKFTSTTRPYATSYEGLVLLDPPKTGGDENDRYYLNTEFTCDTDKYLPPDKTLYAIIDCCHSGGEVNFWQFVRPKENHRHQLMLLAAASPFVDGWSYGSTSSEKAYTPLTRVFDENIKLKDNKLNYEVAQIIFDKMEAYMGPPPENPNGTGDNSPFLININVPYFNYSHPALCTAAFCAPSKYLGISASQTQENIQFQEQNNK